MDRQTTAAMMLLLVLCSGLLSAQTAPAAGQPTPPTRRVLILNEANPSSTAIAQIDEGIWNSLRGSKNPIEIYYESLDTPLFPNQADQQLIRDFYVRKYRDHRPDVIITVGSSPLQFMAEEHSQQFAGIPVVFTFPSGAERNLKPDPDFTGVTMGIGAAATLRAALQMFPKTSHVYVVTGAGAFDLTVIQEVKRQLNDFSRLVDISYSTGLAMPEIWKRVNSLPKDSIVLFTSLSRDGAGAHFDARQTGLLINSAANVPVFSLADLQIGYGQVGGYLINIRAQGDIAGSEALKILNGAKPSDIPVANAPNGFVFDWRALQRWGISESSLPADSVVLYRQPTVWELYRRYIVGGISLIALEALLIFGLLLNRARARKAEAVLAVMFDRLRLASEDLQKEKSFTDAVVDSLPDIFFVIRPTGQFVHWGRNPERILGYSPDETQAMSQAVEIVAEEDRQLAALAIGEGFSQGSVTVEVQLLHRDGRKIPYLIRATQALIGSECLLVGIGMDISVRKHAEAELGRLNRALQTIVECRRRMAEAQEEKAMLTDVCQVLVDLGGYRLVWVAFAEIDEEKSVRPVVHAGHNEGYVEALRLTWADSERGHGPAGTAIRTGQPSVAWNISNDPRMAPWRDEAVRHGIVSTISLPLLRDGRAFGALTLHSLEVEPFDDKEMSLLADLANDVAYGIQALRTRADREQTAQKLQESEARFRTIFEESGLGILLLDLTGRPLKFNPAFQQMIGYSESELLGMSFTDFTHPDHREHDSQLFSKLLEGNHQSKFELEKLYIRKDGQILLARLTISLIKDSQGQPQYTMAMVQDITERRRAVDALRSSETQLREAEYIASLGSSIVDVETGTGRLSPEMYRILGLDPAKPVPHQSERGSLYTPESWKRLGAAFEKAVATGEPYDLEVQFVRRDGAIRWGFARGRAVHDDTGRVVQVHGTLQDITESRRAAEVLRSSEAQLREAEQIANLGSSILDVETRTGALSPGMYRILGLDPTQPPPPNSERSSLYTPESWKRLGAAVEKAIATGEPYAMEVQFVRRDGAIRWGYARGKAVRDNTGRVVRIHGTLQDITRRKLAEEQIKASEENYLLLLNSTAEGIFGIDMNGDCIFSNPSCLRLLGYGRSEELLGMNMHQLVHHSHPDGSPFPAGRCRILMTILDGKGTHVDDEVMWRKDGSSFPAEYWSHPIFKEGKQAGGVITFLDISNRKRAEEAQLRLRQAVNASGEVVYMTDREGIITFVNPEFTRLYEFSEEEVIGKERDILKDYDVSEADREGFWQTALTQGSARGEIVNKTKSGRKVSVERSASAVRDEHGNIVAFISIQRDITARKQLEQQFLQAQKMEAVGQLAGGVAHDFNNLLGIITGYAELTLDDHSLPESARQRVNEINEAAKRAAEVTRQLLALSRKQVLQKRVLDINSVVNDTTKMLQRLVGEHIEFATRLAPDLGSVEADPSGMDQVLMNLVINARDAMPDGGKLTIETTNVTRQDIRKTQHHDLPAGDYVALIVTDTGIGMSSEIRKHIFEPFFTTKQQGSGTGLGLSTVYGIVQQSGGFLFVDSEPGRGAKFTIYLPRVGATVASVQRPNAEAVPRGSETVLLVEDYQKLRQMNAELLLGLGYNVIEGGNADEAIAAAQTHSGPLHLLMTDVIMPGINGHKLAELLSESRPEMRVLFVSGYTESAIAKQIADSGAMFLQKPYTRNTLAAKLREVLNPPIRRKMQSKRPT